MDLATVKIVFPNKWDVINALDGDTEERVAALYFTEKDGVLTITRVVPLTNDHEDKKHHYAVKGSQLSKLKGTYILSHSHPDPYHKQGPSKADIQGLTRTTKLGAVYLPWNRLLILFTKDKARSVVVV